MSALHAEGFPEAEVRRRARQGAAAAFPPVADYGAGLFGARAQQPSSADSLEGLRLIPPVFMPGRLDKLIELGREPGPQDVDLRARIGGLAAPLPLYVSAFGSTRAAGTDTGMAVARQAGLLGLPMVVGENVVPVAGYRGSAEDGRVATVLLDRIRSYVEHVPDGTGGVIVQQSTEDADAEVWNQVYSDPDVRLLLESGRLGFELKVGQGAKPGLGGMTVVDEPTAARLDGAYRIEPVGEPGREGSHLLRCSSAGTFTADILTGQIVMMRNNFPRCRVWVKLTPGRDVGVAAAVAREAGADAVAVDGAEAGTGWAPAAFLQHVGLPLGECLMRLDWPPESESSLLASGRMWEGARAAKALALGARAVGLGRAALLAADEDPKAGLIRLVGCLELELRMLVSALGRYAVGDLGREDLWPLPAAAAEAPLVATPT